MVALNRGASCRNAEPYYYDFLLGPSKPAVPDSVADHIRNCAHCREAVRRLEEALAESETASAADPPKNDAGLIDALSLHFEYIGEYVTCAQVKPFLPALSMPSAQIRIPTPITVHLDNCPQCVADLDAIGGLNLNAEQLARLSRLFGESPSGNSALCRRAEASIPILGSGSPAEIDAEILDHLCVCPPCRARLYEYRQEVLTKQRSDEPGASASACDGLCPADIFDCVIPYGLTATGPESPTAAHVRACPACLEKMQSLHRTLYDIAERADSDTVTVYDTKDQGKQARANADDRYARYGIDVRVIGHAGEPVPGRFRPAADTRTARKRRILRPAIKPFVKAAALAALIPLALVLLVHTRSASGTGPDEIANAFAKAANVHVQLFHPDRTEPIRELWVSRQANVLMMTEGVGHVLYDVNAKERRLATPLGEIAEPAVLDERERRNVRNTMEGCLGLSLAGIPVDRQWQHVAHDDARGIDVCELTWRTHVGSGSTYLVKWEVAIDSTTKLPAQTRLFRKYSAESEWECQSRREFTYPTEAEIRSAIGEHFPAGAAAPI